MDSTHTHGSDPQPEHNSDDTANIPAYSALDDTTAYPAAPTPPPPAASYPTPPAGLEQRTGNKRIARNVAGAVGALVLVIGSGAAGIAIGHASVGGSTSARQPTSLGTSAPQTGNGSTGGSNGYSYGYGFGGQNGSPFGQGFGSGQGSSGSSQQTATSTTASSTQIKGLVRIQTTLGYEDGEGAGTGMILSSDGEVLTNHHVVEGATKITATVMSTGKTYTAEVVGTDATADVAVIKLEGASGLTTVNTDSTLPSTGAKVTAVGDANGTEDHLTASPGSVTATGQTITTSSEEGDASETLHNLIEVAAGVVGGDSGGAVYDSSGDVVGMTTAASTTQAVGYAIPIKTALSVAGDLQDHVSKTDYTYGLPAFLGVALSAEGTTAGTTIAKVYASTPASKAGMVAGDTITRVGSTKVSTGAALQKAIKALSPGDSVRITWTDSSGSSHIATVTLIDGPVA